MNRRDFLEVVAAAFAARSVPAVPSWLEGEEGEFVSIDAMRRAAQILKNKKSPLQYTVFMHPGAEADLLAALTPREAWTLAYRQARLGLKRYAKKIMASGEIGSYSNVRFIKSERIAA
ncbi:MAG: hypothetical protein A3E01_08160 [Gammaproteobacteria bacterium RIFCSPHIGHO2_12_FULL_63_22]|nr:MAG: hypothetical protein A3E01_08160 [Gammaproteobacteria bacterium RIFCSPHIGHO2_12_FULL_63_22]